MKKILLTCGLGDFIALETHLTPEEKLSVTSIYWATRARKSLQQLVPFVFPNVTEEVIVEDDWTSRYSVASAAELIEVPGDVVDLNVKSVALGSLSGQRRPIGSTLAAVSLCDVSGLKLPSSYAVLHPYSENARSPLRDLTQREVSAVGRACKFPLVVIGQGSETFVYPPGTLDLMNQLTLLQALEITKRSSAFFGCASVFSVIASKLLYSTFIKGSPELRDHYSFFYYGPGRRVHSNLFPTLSQVT